MLQTPTINKLNELKMNAMVHAWQDQQKDAHVAELSFDDRFAMLVDAEYLARDNKRLSRLLKNASLRIQQACLEDLRDAGVRGIDQAVVRQLAGCMWVKEHLNVLISGPTGAGKSYLSCALGQAACRNGLRVAYRRAPRFFSELQLARADGSYPALLAKLQKHDVLILDDLGVGTCNDVNRQDLLEVLDDRYMQKSTIVSSQLPVAKWHEWLGEATLADALLDRLVHNAHKLTLIGESVRKEEGKKKRQNVEQVVQ